MELNKENLLEMLKEYTKERPISFGQVMVYWADFLGWLDTRGLTLHAAEQDTMEALFQDITDFAKRTHMSDLELHDFARFLRERLVR